MGTTLGRSSHRLVKIRPATSHIQHFKPNPPTRYPTRTKLTTSHSELKFKKQSMQITHLTHQDQL
ncbi:hypothetical protein PGTUg99_014404 [Puccinia graminis f. sp. tritici]|uniref:Uncharacterized protein n=1 Tax=Puccinia graminis f. sp. tritici TaxID=56615 RepID=A0A5B0M509_PUCGR|nr:hypothetical protein PGTUg99_014404 [Puccinia graminis f. sp. tritici]